MQLRALRYFHEVARRASLRKAADRLYVTFQAPGLDGVGHHQAVLVVFDARPGCALTAGHGREKWLGQLAGKDFFSSCEAERSCRSVIERILVVGGGVWLDYRNLRGGGLAQ